MRSRALLAILWLILGEAYATDQRAFRVTEVAPGLFVHEGRHVSLDHPEHSDIANIGFIIGDACVAVIDSGGSVEVGQALRGEIRRLTSRPVCYLINTHGHFDHVLGNLAFARDKPKIIGHKGLAAAVAANRGFFLDSFPGALGAQPSPESILAPDIGVEGTRELDIGNRKLVLKAYPPAHTEQDLTVLDSRTNTLWLGDLLFMERTPVLDGSLKGWIEMLEVLESLTFARVIPGHGPGSAVWPDAVKPQLRYLKLLLAETRAWIARGGTLEEAVSEIGNSERNKWVLFDDVHRRNVTRAFAELEWE